MIEVSEKMIESVRVSRNIINGGRVQCHDCKKVKHLDDLYLTLTKVLVYLKDERQQQDFVKDMEISKLLTR